MISGSGRKKTLYIAAPVAALLLALTVVAIAGGSSNANVPPPPTKVPTSAPLTLQFEFTPDTPTPEATDAAGNPIDPTNTAAPDGSGGAATPGGSNGGSTGGTGQTPAGGSQGAPSSTSRPASATSTPRPATATNTARPAATDTQPPAATNTQPPAATNTQPPAATNTQPPAPTNTQPPAPTATPSCGGTPTLTLNPSTINLASTGSASASISGFPCNARLDICFDYVSGPVRFNSDCQAGGIPVDGTGKASGSVSISKYLVCCNKNGNSDPNHPPVDICAYGKEHPAEALPWWGKSETAKVTVKTSDGSKQDDANLTITLPTKQQCGL